MNWPLVVLAVVGLVTLGVVAEMYERRVARREREREDAAQRRRIIQELDGHE